jgi:hypothetical protein
MCMVEGADGDGYIDFSSEWPTGKGRKEYRCYECHRTIAIGESFVNHVWKYDGELSHVRTCAHCAVACEWLSKNCNGYLIGTVLEDIDEHVHEYSHVPIPACIPDLVLLQTGMRHKWVIQDGPQKGQLSSLPALPCLLEPATKAA